MLFLPVRTSHKKQWFGSKAGIQPVATQKGKRHLRANFLFVLLWVTLFQPWQAGAEEKAAAKTQSGDAATISLGGRLYDNTWAVVGAKVPTGRYGLYPKNPKVPDVETWRCKSCHGWDYVGRDGHLGQQEIKGRFANLRAVIGRKTNRIEQYLKYSNHRKLVTPLSKKELKALALFLSAGQHDLSQIIGPGSKAKGDPKKGKDIYEGVCSRCHQPDGKAPLYSEEGSGSSLGWLSRHSPARVVHKIRNGVTSADMLSLRSMELDDIGDLVAYLQTLDPQ
ncbi:MAG: c-type cytochrome [Hyphomicrobiaceae bacterium]